jgi:ketosteroid isomerase-like protein
VNGGGSGAGFLFGGASEPRSSARARRSAALGFAALAAAAGAAAPRAAPAQTQPPPPAGAPARPGHTYDAAAHAAAERDAREIEATIRGLHSALEGFFQDGKVGRVMEYYDSLIHYFSPAGTREDAAQVRKRLLSHAPRVKSFRTQVSPMTIRVSGDLAWASCEVHEEYVFDGRPGEEDLLSTYVLERRAKGWRIVHEHQSLLLGEEPAEAAPGPLPLRPPKKGDPPSGGAQN